MLFSRENELLDPLAGSNGFTEPTILFDLDELVIVDARLVAGGGCSGHHGPFEPPLEELRSSISGFLARI